MISVLIIHSDVVAKETEIEKILKEYKLFRNHPDLLWFESEAKLGVEQAKQVQQFLNLKPYQGSSQGVVLISAENLTLDAQNALLKTLEEPPHQAIIILGVSSEDQLLPTILSRCKIINLQNSATPDVAGKYQKEIEKLLQSSIEQRFQFVEKLDNKEEFLYALTAYFRTQALNNIEHPMFDFLKDLLEAEKWAKHNVNIRAILEYLMLKMPVFNKQA